MRYLVVFAAMLLACVPADAQVKRKRILAIGEVQGWQHDSVSHALATIERMGRESGLWDTYIRTDTQQVTKKNLNQPRNLNIKTLKDFDAVLFYTTGELKMEASQKADLLSFIRDEGKAFIGIHSASDTFYEWPEYGEMIGGYFDEHPWGTFDAPLIIEDPSFPGMSHLPKEFVYKDEIYQHKGYSRDRVRVLIRLDPAKLDMTNKRVHRKDGDFAVAWARQYGKGRVYYNNLGHREETWDDPRMRTMFLEGIKWALGMTQADATPRALNTGK